MNEREIEQKQKEGKFVIKAMGPEIRGNPFEVPFPRRMRKTTFAVLESFDKNDLPQLKRFAAERLKCKEKEVEIEVFEPTKQ